MLNSLPTDQAERPSTCLCDAGKILVEDHVGNVSHRQLISLPLPDTEGTNHDGDRPEHRNESAVASSSGSGLTQSAESVVISSSGSCLTRSAVVVWPMAGSSTPSSPVMDSVPGSATAAASVDHPTAPPPPK